MRTIYAIIRSLLGVFASKCRPPVQFAIHRKSLSGTDTFSLTRLGSSIPRGRDPIIFGDHYGINHC